MVCSPESITCLLRARPSTHGALGCNQERIVELFLARTLLAKVPVSMNLWAYKDIEQSPILTDAKYAMIKQLCAAAERTDTVLIQPKLYSKLF